MKKNLKRRDFIKKVGIAGAAATAVSTFPAPAIAAIKTSRIKPKILLKNVKLLIAIKGFINFIKFSENYFFNNFFMLLFKLLILLLNCIFFPL